MQLATVVFVAVRGFQYAWPPLAYSVQSDEEAARLYSLVATYFMLGTGLVVAAVTLLARWMVRLLLAPQFYGAYRALPWLALGWSLYGLYLVLLVIAGRARVTKRNFPAAAAGLGANVLLLVLLVPGERRRPRHRRRGDRALRGVRRDARRLLPSDPQPVPGRLRLAPARPARRRSSPA